MASRALESRRDRYKVMLVTPFMSCNARLTIYILFAEMFFGKQAMLAAYSMYLIGIAVAILVSLALHLLDREKSDNYLLIELPEYKMPDARTIGIYNPGINLKRACSVNPRRVVQISGYSQEELAQQENVEGSPSEKGRKNQRPIGINEIQVPPDHKLRNQCHRGGQHHGGQDHGKAYSPALPFHPGKGISRHG